MTGRFLAPSSKAQTTLIPVEDDSTFWMSLKLFDYTANAKNGCQGLKVMFKDVQSTICYNMFFKYQFCQLLDAFRPADFPSNQQFIVLLPEILAAGYNAAYGSILVKFPLRSRDGSRLIKEGTAGIVDGFAKVISMLSILVIIKELDLSPDELSHPVLRTTLESFVSIQVSYKHHEHPAHYYLQSLSYLAFRFC